MNSVLGGTQSEISSISKKFALLHSGKNVLFWSLFTGEANEEHFP
jgi:hypothetical protein